MSKDIETLRNHLFDVIEGLKNGTMEIDKAKAISNVAQTMINAAKVEVAYAQVTGHKGSKFLEKQPELPSGITGITVHKAR